MKPIYAYLCEKGVGRKKNQDSVFFQTGAAEGCRVCLAAVCDGVGAYADSEFAGGAATDYLNQWFQSRSASGSEKIKKNPKITYENLKNSLREKLWLAHRYVVEETEKKQFKAATTICVILTVENRYCVYSSGDSRAYEIGKNLRLLTKDQVIRNGDYTTLSNCLGCFPGPEFARIEGKIKKGMSYLLTTDGFHHHLDGLSAVKSFKKLKSSPELNELLHTMREDFTSAGEKDDITAAAVKFI